MNWIDRLRRACGRGPYTTPEKRIGVCALCRTDVRYGDGHDFSQGRVVHFRCASLDADAKVARVKATNAFLHLRERIRHAPEIGRALDRAIVLDCTRELSAPNLLRLVVQIEDAIKTTPPDAEGAVELSAYLESLKRSFAPAN